MTSIKWLKRILIAIPILISILIFMGFVYEQISRFTADQIFPAHGEILDMGKHKLHYLKKGNGRPTVVFESGLDPGGHLPWYKVQDKISKLTTTLSYDRAGILWSERGDNPKQLDSIAKELKILLKKTNCPEPYIIVGHSIAGVMLREFIYENSNSISGIVFVDVSHPDLRGNMSDELKEYTTEPSGAFMKFANSIGLIRLFFTDMYPNTNDNDIINKLIPALAYKGIPTFIEEQNKIDLLNEEARKITSFDSIPLSIITGANPDRFNMIKDLKMKNEMEKVWENSQNDLLNLSFSSKRIMAYSSSHYIQLQEPIVVIDAITELLNSN